MQELYGKEKHSTVTHEPRLHRKTSDSRNAQLVSYQDTRYVCLSEQMTFQEDRNR